MAIHDVFRAIVKCDAQDAAREVGIEFFQLNQCLDKAMQLLSRVVSIFPRGDQRYKEAYKLLNQLAAEEED